MFKKLIAVTVIIDYCCFAIYAHNTQIFESKHSDFVPVSYYCITTNHKNSVAYLDEHLFNSPVCGSAGSQLVWTRLGWTAQLCSGCFSSSSWDQPASGASRNPQGLLRPRLSTAVLSILPRSIGLSRSHGSAQIQGAEEIRSAPLM